MTRRGKVFLVGAGPGDPGLLTLKAARAIAGCDALVYDYVAPAPIVALAPPDCEKIYIAERAGASTVSHEAITALLVRLGREGKRVVRLEDGDVFVFARGGEEARALHDAGVPFEIVPGILAALAAPAYAGIPITHRAHDAAFTVARGPADRATGFSPLDFAKLADPAQTLVFAQAMGNLPAIVAKLREAGMPGDLPVAIVREGTTPAQQTLTGTLESIVADVERTKFVAPAIVVIGNVVRERDNLRWFDTTPLFGKRVLVTRPAGSAGEFASRLWEAGAEPLVAPTIAIVPPDDAAAAENAVRAAAGYAWIVFTSRTGVDAFFERLSRAGDDARALGGVKVAAIGTKTAEGLLARGIQADFVPAHFVAEEVAAGLLERTQPGERVLIFRAQEARDVVPDALHEAGRDVTVAAAYKTVYRRDPAIAEAAASAEIWTFTSPATVRGLLSNVADAAARAAKKTIACIGPVTAQAARACGLPVHAVAQESTIEGIVDALAAVTLPA